MSSFKSVAIAATALLSLGACATRASGVAPVAVSSGDYAGMSCADTRNMLLDRRAAEASLTSKQNSAATADAIGVFFLLVPAGSVFGGNVEGQLAQAKGEVMALSNAVRQNCAGQPDTPLVAGFSKPVS